MSSDNNGQALSKSATKSVGANYDEEFNESILEVEEIYVYTLSFLQSLTLKEYVKNKLNDLLKKKRK